MINRKIILEEFLEDIHVVWHKLMTAHSFQKKVSITPSQGFVLRFVCKNNSTNAKKIADSLNITSSAATQLINGLVENGYLTRKENTKDRRISHLFLSKKAENLFKEFNNQSIKKMVQVFSVLTDDELIQYTNINRKIIKNTINKK
jgi:DNA-binding MarR family transcriptional regulator